ncbi:PAS domain-containing protein [uncultured Enterovirga sp.]|uniref:PAS domain-containing protein n=1 Tax=uncultured Enterovirga sp. TaxID=2026352 RepID=UPI0035CAD575
MASGALQEPAFGQADLSNCEREQIHLAASIQPHGALLVVSGPDLTVVQASANASTFLGIRGPVLGRSLCEFGGDIAQLVRASLAEVAEGTAVALRVRVGDPAGLFDGTMHRSAGNGFIIELERAGCPSDVSPQLETAVRTILACSSLLGLCDDTARIFKALTGYDRVMVYRFDDEGHGEVISEQREHDLEPYLGNRYPASDIPQIARRLYERNRVRVLVDIQYDPVELQPVICPLTGQDLDMSLCTLRSMSPIHIQYLQNMGVAATLVISLIVGRRLWGLIACHHYVPRVTPFEVRAAGDVLAEVVGTRIAALESFIQSQAETSVRRLEQRMIEAVARDGDWKVALFDGSQLLLQATGATGAALLLEDQVFSTGEVPGTPQLKQLGQWLDSRPRLPVAATASLAADEPRFSPLVQVAAGLLAAPITRSPGEYLLWFRPERVRTVTWGGDPRKPVLLGHDPAQLSPRRSFAQWHEIVEGTSEPWGAADLNAARLIAQIVEDIVVQFRSVRMLIAQDQLVQVSGQVENSDQPLVIASPQGQIIVANKAFENLFQVGSRRLQWIEDLSSLFADPGAARNILRELLAKKRTWRGELLMDAATGSERPLLLRADPVLTSSGRLLGYVLLFADLTERKAAETARRRFQDGILEPHRPMTGRLDTRMDLVFHNVLSSIIENAQLAALEITDSLEVSRMPHMLESVRCSVERTTEVLEQFMRHASRTSRN